MGNIALESGRSWNGVGQPLMAWYPSSLRGGRRRGLEWSKDGEEWVQRVRLGWRGQGLGARRVGLRGGRCGCRGGVQVRGL